MPALTNFELVLINGEVVQQDVGYNSMLGKLEPENWFWFDKGGGETFTNIIQTYKEACRYLPYLQTNNFSVHIVNVPIPEDSSSVMCIPAKSILCIRKINPQEEGEHLESEQHLDTEEREIVPLSQELRRMSREHGLIIEEEERASEQREGRVATRRFERRRRPVIRRKK